MTRLRKCSWRLGVLTLLIAGLVIWLACGNSRFTSAMTAGNLRPANGNASQSNLDPARESALRILYHQIKGGAPSALEEREVLLRFMNREPVSELEADAVISRAIYKRYVADQRLNKKQK